VVAVDGGHSVGCWKILQVQVCERGDGSRVDAVRQRMRVNGKRRREIPRPATAVNCADRLLRRSEVGGKSRSASLSPEAGRRNDKDVWGLREYSAEGEKRERDVVWRPALRQGQRMLRKGPTLAKSARMEHPTSKAKTLQSQRVLQAATHKTAANGSGVDEVSQTAVGGKKKGLDIFLYGNVMLGHGEGGYYIGCV